MALWRYGGKAEVKPESGRTINVAPLNRASLVLVGFSWF